MSKKDQKYYDERLYIKDGMLQQIKLPEKIVDGKATLVETYVEYTGVTEEDIHNAIDEYLESKPKILRLQVIIFESLKKATGIPIIHHVKTKSCDMVTKRKIEQDDPLYKKLIGYVQSSPKYLELKELSDAKNQSRNERIQAAILPKKREQDLRSHVVSACRRRKKERG